MDNLDSQDSPRPKLGESHHFSPYNILCASPWDPRPNGILFRDFQMGVPKLSKLGFPRLWGPITSPIDLVLRWGLKQNCSTHWEFFNNMSHVTCAQVNLVNSRLLVVKNQIVNLTPDLFLAITCVSNVQMGHANPF